ncbi:MAG: hypothetical protein KIT80_21920 [Chitinophagaceae bacterium]|nr:hypothetical protein [Chitinophagaceae bacterium]MCW5929594.1 hypothetical protein [Chitinophagaceae bacterium]
MKRLLSVLLLHVLVCTCVAQQPYWQQQVSYRIDAHLDDRAHALDGFAKIQYSNRSPDTLHYIWMHLWANAFKNDRTAYSDQAIQNGDTRFYFSEPDQRGYINQLDFRIDEVYVPVEDHPEHQDIVKLLLPAPLIPGQTITITTPFHVKIPYNFSEGGHTGQVYEMDQWWYPQPAVYDREGWHEMPWLTRGRPYTYPASFDVSISLPSNYVVVAPGDMPDDAEKAWLLQRADFDWKEIKQRVKLKGGTYKTVRQQFPKSDTTSKTLRFVLKEGYGFSWIADKRFRMTADTLQLSGRDIRINYYRLPGQKQSINMDELKQAIRFYDHHITGYPGTELNIVQSGKNKTHSGGIQIRSDSDIPELVSQMWFQQVVGSNPRACPWMSNGLATWYDNAYRRNSGEQTTRGKIQKIALASQIAIRKDQPANLEAPAYTPVNYRLSTGTKTAAWLAVLQNKSGADLEKVLATYSRQWKFRQAYPADFHHLVDSFSKGQTNETWNLLSATGNLTPSAERKTKFVFIGKTDAENKYRYIGLAPALGYNHYDKLMFGAVIHNYQLPPTPLKFFIALMYATGSRKLNGIGRLSYTGYPQSILYSWEAGLDLAKFTYNRFTDEEGHSTRLGFSKLAPYIQLNLRNDDPRRTRSSYLRLKHYFIQEENFQFQYDSLAQKMTVDAVSSSRTFGQIKLVMADSRVLYPYHLELQFENAKDFGRLAFTGNYFFNYPKGGGLELRGFAGKFFHFGSRNYNNSRYYLNMTAPNGGEDYAYSNYFIGRSEFRGWMSQQVMMRDGGFKVRTDLLGNKTGRTDNWLMALNLHSSIHPKIPLRVFADLGTFSDAWAAESDQPRLLYDAGLQLSLLKNTVNIYVPLLYSNVYRDYFRLYAGFWQRISFSIDIQSITFKKLHSHFRHHGL